MSDIFDALQRSEGERSGNVSPVPSAATELLRRAERRAVSKWEATALGEQPGATEGSDCDRPSRLNEGSFREASERDLTALDFSSTDKSADVFGQFRKLPISITAQSRLICFTDNQSLGAEAFRLLRVRLRDLQRKRQLKKVLITSTIPQEGKSVSTANLACTLARRATQRILVLEGRPPPPVFVADIRSRKSARIECSVCATNAV